MKKLQILIADDHPIFRRGLVEMLKDELPGSVFTEAGSAEQALALVRKQKWDALLLDINMPGRSGLEILKDIKLARPKLPVLILSAASEDQYGARVLKLGAAGFITKLSAPAQIADAVKTILAGEFYVSSKLAVKIARGELGETDHPRHAALSEREMEILRRIAAGKGTSEIAAELSLSAPTISTYRARILEKLGVKTSAEMIRYAIENKIGAQD